MKRITDIVFSSLLLLLLFPVLVATSIVVCIDLGKPIFFKQLRAGRDGKVFELIKFRTMREDAEKKIPDAARLTRIGRFLRSSSLDELPELWNVIRGDMSLVGPRPLLPEYTSLYTEYQARRLEARPGITGWAQIHGRNGISWDKKFALDIWYIDNASILLDLKIILSTLRCLIFVQSIDAPEGVGMNRFDGSHDKTQDFKN